jgi:hypothetical protein
MRLNTYKKVTKQTKKKQTKKKKGGVKFFSKSKSVSNTNNDEKEFITNQNEMINELNSELLTLDKQNKTLNAGILTLNKQNEMLNEKNNNNNKKKTCDLSLINDILIPISYMRISKRFPHLNLQEIIDFEKKVRENGGSIQVHKGTFKLINNTCRNSNGSTHGTDTRYIKLMWDCCPLNVVKPDTRRMCCNSPVPGHRPDDTCGVGNNIIQKMGVAETIVSNNPTHDDSNNLIKNGVTFYLNEEDEKIQKVNIEEINSVINNNIDIFKKTIDNYSAKINELEIVKKNIN